MPPADPPVNLKAIRFTGNTVFSAEELQPLVAERIGQSNTLADLEALAMRITEKYRNTGYMLAQAIVPVQDVTSGEVEISVIEGVLGKVRLEIDPAAPIRPAVIERIASRLKPGQPLHSRTLERVMLLLSDLPGIAPQAALEQGEVSGTTDVIIVIGPERRWEFSVDADNHGSRSTGEVRFGVLGRINSPLRLGDNLDARIQLGSGGGLTYGRLGYELPLGGDGTRIGVAYSRLEYELGKDFADLDGSGQADVVELSLTHPLIRSRARNLVRQAWLAGEVAGRSPGSIQRNDGKRIRSLNVGLAYEERDRFLGGGYTSASVTAFLGELRLSIRESQRELTTRRVIPKGHFEHWNYTVSRLNALSGRMNLFFGITGQFTDKNLDSAEKIALGGPRAVRAYAPSEATVDEGHVANLELRYSLLPEVSLQGFYDWGWGRFNRRPLGRRCQATIFRCADTAWAPTGAARTASRCAPAWPGGRPPAAALTQTACRGCMFNSPSSSDASAGDERAQQEGTMSKKYRQEFSAAAKRDRPGDGAGIRVGFPGPGLCPPASRWWPGRYR